MNECAFPMGLTALAVAIARECTDDETLALVAAAFVQLGDSLSTILAQRALCASLSERQEEQV